MNQNNVLTGLINLHVGGMSEVLGMSFSDTIERCTIRELLLYIGTMAAAPQATATEPTPAEQSSEDRIKAWEAEVGN